MPAPRNRTIRLSRPDRIRLQPRLLKLQSPVRVRDVLDTTIHQDLFAVLPLLPRHCADLIVVDPPYNLTKSFGKTSFKARSHEAYVEWLETWLPALLRTAKPTASVYLCSDWRSSPAVHQVAAKYLTVRSRITWEREKGRGAKANWKNASEDIFFCTVSDRYTFNLDSVKVRRRVLAPYRNDGGAAKDWLSTVTGNIRITHPSNLWTDLTVPFWSMPENTDHPTQKPEKLVAKLILASSRKGNVVLDPFLGSGTTSVVAKKLGRHYIGIERELDYCLLAERRLEAAETDDTIQGYEDSVFWERNSR